MVAFGCLITFNSIVFAPEIVLVSGGFDPLHSGHIQYLTQAKTLGSKLVVAVNSNGWLTRKKGNYFLPMRERIAILKALTVVDDVIEFNDSDDSAIDAINVVKQLYPYSNIIFANGGDRIKENTPEDSMFLTDNKISFVYGVGGDNKLNSSSTILENYISSTKTKRAWGHYIVLYNKPTYKVKELSIYPSKSISKQRHKYRNEVWFIIEGIATALYQTEESKHNKWISKTLPTFSIFRVPVGMWHTLSNHKINMLRVIEIQYGSKCVEHDISRI